MPQRGGAAPERRKEPKRCAREIDLYWHKIRNTVDELVAPFDITALVVYATHMDRNSRAITRRLRRDGWELDRVRGSHHQFVHPERPGVVTVAHPVKDIPTETLRNIYWQAGWKWRTR